jgi:hypothetical protein
MNFANMTDEQVTALHKKLEKRKKWLMSPQAKAYRDKLMRSAIAKSYETTRSRGGEFEFKGAVDVFEERIMREDCKKADGTNFINQDYWDWKQKDLHLRGLDGAWLNR